MQDRECVFLDQYTYISGLSMPLLAAHNIHGPTRPTACVTHIFACWMLNTNLFAAMIVSCEVFPACLSAGASFAQCITLWMRSYNFGSYVFSRLLYLYSMPQVGQFHGSKTGSTSQPSVRSILSICARVQPYLSSLILVYAPPSCSGTRLRSTDGGGGGSLNGRAKGKKSVLGVKNF